jgi:hypothetical protein
VHPDILGHLLGMTCFYSEVYTLLSGEVSFHDISPKPSVFTRIMYHSEKVA